MNFRKFIKAVRNQNLTEVNLLISAERYVYVGEVWNWVIFLLSAQAIMEHASDQMQ